MSVIKRAFLKTDRMNNTQKWFTVPIILILVLLFWYIIGGSFFVLLDSIESDFVEEILSDLDDVIDPAILLIAIISFLLIAIRVFKSTD